MAKKSLYLLLDESDYDTLDAISIKAKTSKRSLVSEGISLLKIRYSKEEEAISSNSKPARRTKLKPIKKEASK